MTTEIQFPQPLQPLFEPHRYKVLYGGRGAGRSWGVARALLLKAGQQSLRVLCAREFQNSIQESVYKVLVDQIYIMGLDSLFDIRASQILGKTPANKDTVFNFEGIKNNTTRIKSYEGIDICWVEEAVKVSKTSWGILIPTIRKEGSEIWMTFNPELEEDYTYERFVTNADSSCAVMYMTWRDNPFFPEVLKEEMLRDRERDYDFYLNVWEGKCLRNLEGTVYAKELRKAEEEGRIGQVGWEKSVPVSTYWDLGRANYTAIWFAQRVAMQTRVLDYYQASLEDITHYLHVAQSKGYVYDTFYLPHDAKAKRLGTKKSIEEMIRGAGYRTQIVPKLSVDDGINAAKLLFNNCWFDERKCKDGLKSLRHYRYKVVDGQMSNLPQHDWASDGADAFRYMALAIRDPSELVSTGVKKRLEKLKKLAERQFVERDEGRTNSSQRWMA